MGVEKAASFVWEVNHYEIGAKIHGNYAKRTVEGYMGIRYSASVEVANMPTAFLALTAELAAAGLPEDELELELELLLRVARTAAITAPAITRTPTGTPNLSHLLVSHLDFLGPGGAI